MGTPLHELLKRKVVAIVGTRKVTPYGKQVTQRLAGELAEQGIVVVSGLAFGVDAIAHKAALDAGGTAIAVLPSPLDNIVPVSNRQLADRILKEGGALISEYPPGQIPGKQNFIARNRLMSGLADAVLITEAGEKSGALYTANFGFEQNKLVFAVPGHITHPSSAGCNNIIKTNKAKAITSFRDILHEMQIPEHTTAPKYVKGRNAHEQAVLNLLLQGFTAGDQLLEKSGLDVVQFNQVLTMLEIGDKIKPLGANHWSLT